MVGRDDVEAFVPGLAQTVRQRVAPPPRVGHGRGVHAHAAPAHVGRDPVVVDVAAREQRGAARTADRRVDEEVAEVGACEPKKVGPSGVSPNFGKYKGRTYQ